MKNVDYLTIFNIEELTETPQILDYSILNQINETEKIKFFRFTTEVNHFIIALIRLYNNYIYGLLLSDHKYSFNTYKAIDIYMNNIITLTERIMHVNKVLYILMDTATDDDDKDIDQYKENFKSFIGKNMMKTREIILSNFDKFLEDGTIKRKAKEIFNYIYSDYISSWFATLNIPTNNGEFIRFISELINLIIITSDKFYLMLATIDRNVFCQHPNTAKCIILKNSNLNVKDIEVLKFILSEICQGRDFIIKQVD